MIHPSRKKRWLFLVGFGLSFSTLVSCAQEKIDFEFTGTVYDKETRQPIEGAYAIAIYKGVVASTAVVSSHCVKTKGMYTGKDGKFRFPVEKRDGYSPWNVEALHLDYEYASAQVKPARIHRAQQAEAYADRDVYLKKLDPKNLLLGGGSDTYCDHAKSKEDAAAAVEHFKIERAQYVKYSRDQRSIDNVNRMIRRLETLDGRPPYEIGMHDFLEDGSLRTSNPLTAPLKQ